MNMVQTGAPCFRFVIITDTHISDTGDSPTYDDAGRMISKNFASLVDQINYIKPDFVIHMGDVTDPLPLSDQYARAAREFHEMTGRLDMPLHLIPGNHDIGEKIHRALPEVGPVLSVSKHNIVQYERHFGTQYHSFEHDNCIFILINSLLINSKIDDEEVQFAWLKNTLDGATNKRVFLFSHYPIFLTNPEEPDHYDNIDQPGRSRILDLINHYGVEAVFSGHVHNLFFNILGKTHLFSLPSTSFLRHDYMELFRISPASRTENRYDPSMTGFFLVDVYPDGYVPHLIRQTGRYEPRTHAWRPKGPMPVLDLRVPWCERADVLTPWGSEIFERKMVRNDYPLFSIWEMGIRDLRIPISDLIDPETAQRVLDLSATGHRFIVVIFGLPNADQKAALERHAASIKGLEIVGFQSQLPAMLDNLAELSGSIDCFFYFNTVKIEIEGYTSHHGIRIDCAEDIEWLSGQSFLSNSRGSLVFNCPISVSPFDVVTDILRIIPDGVKSFSLHVPCVIMHRTDIPEYESRNVQELNRVAEATLLARAHPEIVVVLDNFVELDRGYFHCCGLVSRLYEPKEGSRILAALAALMPSNVKSTEIFQTPGCRVIVARDSSVVALLLLSEVWTAERRPVGALPSRLAERTGRLFDLSTGEEREGSFVTFQDRFATDQGPFKPQLLLLEGAL